MYYINDIFNLCVDIRIFTLSIMSNTYIILTKKISIVFYVLNRTFMKLVYEKKKKMYML